MRGTFGRTSIKTNNSQLTLYISIELFVKTNLSSVPSVQLNSRIGGAKKTILNWCQATGNLTQKIARQIKMCHRPKDPIELWTMSESGFGSGSGSTSVSALLFTETVTKSKLLISIEFMLI